jgi:hypothetical protein
VALVAISAMSGFASQHIIGNMQLGLSATKSNPAGGGTQPNLQMPIVLNADT